MATVNIWLAISDAAQTIVRESLMWDEEAQGPYTGPLRNRSRRLFEYMNDSTSRVAQWKRPNLSGTVYNLWSIDFDTDPATLLAVEDEILYLQGEYPNQLQLVGAWKPDGAMVGCTLVLTEIANPDYTGEPYRISNPAYQPDPDLPDFDSREFLRNPAYVSPTITQRTQTGTPRHALPTWLWRFVPDTLDFDGNVTWSATSNADLKDTNLLYGQSPRVFS